MSKRYGFFAWEPVESFGGLNDLVYAFDEVSELTEFLRGYEDSYRVSLDLDESVYYWSEFQIVDFTTLEVLCSHADLSCEVTKRDIMALASRTLKGE